MSTSGPTPARTTRHHAPMTENGKLVQGNPALGNITYKGVLFVTDNGESVFDFTADLASRIVAIRTANLAARDYNADRDVVTASSDFDQSVDTIAAFQRAIEATIAAAISAEVGAGGGEAECARR